MLISDWKKKLWNNKTCVGYVNNRRRCSLKTLSKTNMTQKQIQIFVYWQRIHTFFKNICD